MTDGVRDRSKERDAVPAHVFALIVEVEIVVCDFLQRSFLARGDCTFVRLLNVVLATLVVNEVDEARVAVQRDMLLKMPTGSLRSAGDVHNHQVGLVSESVDFCPENGNRATDLNEGQRSLHIFGDAGG